LSGALALVVGGWAKWMYPNASPPADFLDPWPNPESNVYLDRNTEAMGVMRHRDFFVLYGICATISPHRRGDMTRDRSAASSWLARIKLSR
jgi:hypothetical protein